MTEIPTEETLIRLSQASKVIRKMTGESIATGTIYRWASRGLSGVRLKIIYAGGYKRTKEVWIREFFAELSRVRQQGGQQVQSVSSARHKKAQAQLAAEGM